MFVIWLLSVLIFVISFFSIFITAHFYGRPIDQYKFSFKRVFPYEISKMSEKTPYFYNFSTYLFSLFCFSPIFVLLNTKSVLSSINPLSILIACVFGLSGIFFVFLNVFGAIHTKAHLALFVSYASMILLGGLLVFVRGFLAFDLCAKHGNINTLLLVTSAIAQLLSLIVIFILLNPRLKKWANLEMVDGKVERPQKFILAYDQWLLLVILFIEEITFFVQLVI